MFDPVDTARRLEVLLRGRRWPTVEFGPLEVTAVVAVRAAWPLLVRLRVECDEWPARREFEIEFAYTDTISGATATGNAESLAEDAMVRLERHLGGGAAPGVSTI